MGSQLSNGFLPTNQTNQPPISTCDIGG